MELQGWPADDLAERLSRVVKGKVFLREHNMMIKTGIRNYHDA